MIEDEGMAHEHRTFHNPPPATPADVRAALDRDDLPSALDAMVGCALYGDGDWKESQELYLALLDHDDHQVQRLAATCLGHLARVYRRLDEQRVVAALRRAGERPHVSGTAGDALDDIESFLNAAGRSGPVTVDALVTLWADSGYQPRPARSHAELEAFAAEVRGRFGLELPADYRRFLTLTDGGQYDHALFGGIGPEDPVLARCEDLRTGPVLVIGGSGNLDAYVLQPGGRADIVTFWDLSEVSESFASFTGLLEKVLTGG